MTSSDVLDTATAVQIMRSGTLIIEALDALTESVGRLALEHADTPIVGRTHGVHAEPMSLGLKFALWWDELSRAGDHLALAVGAAAVGKLSGAVGTYANVDPRVEEQVCRALGVRPASVSSQIVPRDRHARYLFALALLGSVIARQALEIRLLARTEASEIMEGFARKQKGSSAMPHKRNPVKCEQLCGLARLLRANAVAGLENVELWHERDISHSSVERVILPDSSIAAHYVVVKFNDVVNSLEIRPDRMLENLSSSRGLVFSGTVLTALIDAGMSREKAYERVQAASAEGAQGGHGAQGRARGRPGGRGAPREEARRGVRPRAPSRPRPHGHREAGHHGGERRPRERADGRREARRSRQGRAETEERTEMTKREKLYEGKAKILWTTDSPEHMVQEFKDDATAFDGTKHAVVQGKGQFNNAISSRLFEMLRDAGIRTHFVRRLSEREMLVERLRDAPGGGRREELGGRVDREAARRDAGGAIRSAARGVLPQERRAPRSAHHGRPHPRARPRPGRARRRRCGRGRSRSTTCSGASSPGGAWTSWTSSSSSA